MKRKENAVIPNQPKRLYEIPYSKRLYKQRSWVEIFFQRIKVFRRIATRYEKSITMYKNVVYIVCMLIWVVF
jgi:transposase